MLQVALYSRRSTAALVATLLRLLVLQASTTPALAGTVTKHSTLFILESVARLSSISGSNTFPKNTHASMRLCLCSTLCPPTSSDPHTLNFFSSNTNGLLALNMSHTSAAASSSSPSPSSSSSSSSSNFQLIINNALDAYKKRTTKDLRAHPLAAQLQTCESPAAILAVLQQQVQGLDQSWNTDERWIKWLDPTVNVLYAFSEILGAGVSLVCQHAPF